MPARPARLLAPAALTALLLGAGAAPPAQAAKAKPCSAAKGRDLVRSKLVRAVDVGTARKHRYVLCAEGGVQRALLARRGVALEFEDSAGAFVTVRDTRTADVRVVNAVSGKARTLKPDRNVLLRPVLVDEAGAAAAERKQTTEGSPSGLIAFDTNGRSYELFKEITEGSLTRSGSRVSWKNGSASFSADLATPDIPCSDLAGTEVFASATARVLQEVYPGIFGAGKRINGTVTRLRGCRPDVTPAPGTLRRPTTLLGTAAALKDPRGGADSIRALGAGGGFVAVQKSTQDAQGRQRETIERVTLGGDERLTLVDFTGPLPAETLGATTYGPFVVTDAGRAATVVVAPQGSSVVAFDAAGAQTVLDTGATPSSIPTQSLTLAGTTANWTNDGVAKAADLGS